MAVSGIHLEISMEEAEWLSALLQTERRRVTGRLQWCVRCRNRNAVDGLIDERNLIYRLRAILAAALEAGPTWHLSGTAAADQFGLGAVTAEEFIHGGGEGLPTGEEAGGEVGGGDPGGAREGEGGA